MRKICHNCFWKQKSRLKPCCHGIEFPFEPCHMFSPKCCRCNNTGKHEYKDRYYCAEHLEQTKTERKLLYGEC